MPNIGPWNQGNIALQIQVENFCPFIVMGPNSFNVIFNQTTLFGLSQKDQVALNSFGDGLTLRQNYPYLNTFGFLPDNYPQFGPSNSASSTNGSSITTNTSFQEIQNQNFQSQDNTSKNAVNYLLQQSFIAAPHPATVNINVANNIPKWSSDSVSYSLTVEGILFQNNNTAATASTKSTGLTNTSRIQTIRQSNVLPGQPVVTQNSPLIFPGVFFALKKCTNIFLGQDFFIEIIQDQNDFDAQGPDSGNNKYGLWTGTGQKSGDPYSVINPYFQSSTQPGQLPENFGVNNYTVSSSSGSTLTTYKVDPSSQKKYSLQTQSHLIIQLGEATNDSCLFIIICSNANPTAILKTKTSQNASTFVGLKLSEFNGSSGLALLKQQRLRITVRNYLGSLVLIFNGQENNPWIIDSQNLLNGRPLQTGMNNKGSGGTTDSTSGGALYILGGNLACQIIYSPLTYSSTYTLNTPGATQTTSVTGQTTTSLSPYSTWLGVQGANSILPQADFSNGYVGNTGLGRRLSPGGAGIAINSGTIFNLDAQDPNSNCYKTPNSSSTVSWLGSNTSPQTGFRAYSQNLSQLSSINISIRSATPAPPSNFAPDVSYFVSDIILNAGSMTFPNRNDSISSQIISTTGWTQSTCTIKYCIPPIFTAINYYYTPNEGDLWPPLGKTITNRVISYSDQMSASDYFTATKSGSLSLNMNDYDQTSLNQNNPIFGTLPNQMTLAEIKNLQKRNFYLNVDVIMQDCSGIGQLATCNNGGGSSFTGSDGNNYFRYTIFSGLANGGTMTKQGGKYVMNCQLLDYTHILKEIKWWNSPYMSRMS